MLKIAIEWHAHEREGSRSQVQEVVRVREKKPIHLANGGLKRRHFGPKVVCLVQKASIFLLFKAKFSHFKGRNKEKKWERNLGRRRLSNNKKIRRKL